jgi:hypothetical protein
VISPSTWGRINDYWVGQDLRGMISVLELWLPLAIWLLPPFIIGIRYARRRRAQVLLAFQPPNRGRESISDSAT